MELFKQRPIREAHIARFMGYALEAGRCIPLDIATDDVVDALEKQFITSTKNNISFLMYILVYYKYFPGLLKIVF